ncbi:hypothetical protein EJB05_15981, partial [Eragrostis curvula]
MEVALANARGSVKGHLRGGFPHGLTAGLSHLNPTARDAVVDDESGPSSRDWTELPPELLVSVLSFLEEIRDLFACAAVSRAWRAGCTSVRRLGLWPDRGPYLVYSSADRDPGTATLHNISTGRSFHAAFPDPSFRSRFVIGSSRGWLVTADERSHLHLLSPVTGAQIALPPPGTMFGVGASFNSQGVFRAYCIHDLDVWGRCLNHRVDPQVWGPSKLRHYLYNKVILFSDPSSGDDCIVLLMHGPDEHLSFARIGDTRWTWLDAMENCSCYCDFIYNDEDGLFYAVRANGEIHTVDLRGPSPEVKVVYREESRVMCYAWYLVQAPWGDLLQVVRQYRDPPSDTSDGDYGYESSDQEEDTLLVDQESKQDDASTSEGDEQDYIPSDEYERDRTGNLTVYKVDLADQKTVFSAIHMVNDKWHVLAWRMAVSLIYQFLILC